MTPEESQLAWFTARGAEIAALLDTRHPLAHELGEDLLAQLAGKYHAAFPARAAAREQRRAETRARRTELYHALWQALHTRALAHPGGADDSEFLGTIADRLPSSGCPRGNCRENFAAYLAAHPPDFSSAAGYFAWTVALHNDINRRAGKPVLSLESARAIWQP